MAKMLKDKKVFVVLDIFLYVIFNFIISIYSMFQLSENLIKVETN